ncbi:MAG: hypothetical protein IKK33_01920, partial [Lachnospiraceae bacterium]|nr:hypothetical protein [Lachnospiraceae bacterium]
KKYLKKWQIHLVIIILIMMKTLQNIWKHKREFQINIFMVIGIDKFQYGEQLEKLEFDALLTFGYKVPILQI